jgi:hypothetical protein
MDRTLNLEERQAFEDTAKAGAAVQAKVDEAFTSLGKAMLALAGEQKNIAESINEVIADRNQQLALIGSLLEKVELLTKLVDSDHARLDVLMGVNGRLKATDVN